MCKKWVMCKMGELKSYATNLLHGLFQLLALLFQVLAFLLELDILTFKSGKVFLDAIGLRAQSLKRMQLA